MTFGIIGAGTVGTILAAVLERTGLYQCAGVNTLSRESYERFTGYLDDGSERQLDLCSLEELVSRCSLIFITTPDDAIAQVAKELHEVMTEAFPNKDAVSNKDALPNTDTFPKVRTLVHCSGSLPWRVLDASQDDVGGKGNRTSCLFVGVHPYRSFASIDDGIASVAGTRFGVDGSDEEAVAFGQELVRTLGGIGYKISEGGKGLYHAAAAISSNYLVTLASMGVELLESIGLTSDESLDLLLPLMQGTMDNLRNRGLYVLTGPIARGDVEVVRRHLEELPDSMRDAYRAMGVLALNLARRQYEKAGRTFSEDAEKELLVLLNNS